MKCLTANFEDPTSAPRMPEVIQANKAWLISCIAQSTGLMTTAPFLMTISFSQENARRGFDFKRSGMAFVVSHATPLEGTLTPDKAVEMTGRFVASDVKMIAQ